MSYGDYLKNYTIVLTESAKKDLKKIDTSIGRVIEKKLEALNSKNQSLDIKKLVEYEEPTYRLRVGDYRVIYEIKEKQIIILVIAIKHRKDAYKI